MRLASEEVLSEFIERHVTRCTTHQVKYNMGVYSIIHASMIRLDQTLSSFKEGERIIASHSWHSLVTESLISAEDRSSIFHSTDHVGWSPILQEKNSNKYL